MPSFLDDLRYALRALRKNPVLASVAMLSLGIGIGANTAIFSLMDRLLFRALPVRDPGRLVLLRSPGGWSGSIETQYGDTVSFSWQKYQALAGRSDTVFEGLLARFPFAASIASKAETDGGHGELVSGNYFELLGVRPALGRLLGPDDARLRGGNPVAVLSHGYWMGRFGGDPDILNQSLVVNGTALTVVGVAQAGFRSVGAGEAPELFAPVTMAPALVEPWGRTALEKTHAYWLNLFGRLRPGVSREQAGATLAVVWQRILASDAGQLPAGARRDRYLAKTLELLEAGNGISAVRDDLEAPLYLLMGMVGVVLLIACVNVANLLLARAVSRGREFAIRVAIGASRWRLARHVLAETLILSLGGGLVGLLIAPWVGHAMVVALPTEVPSAGLTADFDWRVLAFAFASAAAAGLLFGCIPALRLSRPDLTPVLRDGAPTATGRPRLRNVLVTGQIALAALLVAAAGLFAFSLHKLRTLDPGFRAAGLYDFSINPQLLGYTPDQSLRLFQELDRELRAVPAVNGVSFAKWPLLTGTVDQHAFDVEGYTRPDGGSRGISANLVGPGFFGVIGLPLLAGREFREGDAAAAPAVAVVNEAFARKYFAERNPLGMRLTEAERTFEIVGVAKDARYDDVRETPKPFVYLAAAQDREPGPMTFYARAASSGQFAAAARSLVRRLDSRLPVEGPRTVEQQIVTSLFVERLIAILASTFASMATALSAIGLYGVVAWAVARRRREIGIRMALGAEPGAVLRMVLKDVLRLALAGLAIAVPLWAIAGGTLKSLLFGVTEHDPLPLAAAFAVTLGVALAAGFVPAWRASRVDPNQAIRSE